MTRFAQHSKVIARDGLRDQLIEKFLESCKVQADNPDCELMVVSASATDDDAVFLTEVWTSLEAHTAATQSPAIAAWAQGMPALVDRLAEQQELIAVGGIGLSRA